MPHQELQNTGLTALNYPQLDYAMPRPAFLSAMFSAGEECGAAAIMPWELTAWHVAPTSSGGFDFGVDDPSFKPVQQMVHFMKNKASQLACTLQSAV
jgi:hypothetical protein